MSFGCFLFCGLFCFVRQGLIYVTQVDPELMTSFLSLLHAGITVLYHHHHASLSRNYVSLVNTILIPNKLISGDQK